MHLEDQSKKLESLMRRQGVISSGDLLKELDVSRATLMRVLAQSPSAWISIGKTHNQQYGWRKSLPELGFELPLFRIDERGRLSPVGHLSFLENNYCLAGMNAQVFNALPPEIHDMSPQGFMGRTFAKNYGDELGGLPPRGEDWNDWQILKVAARRGEDFPGNLILGVESAERWQKKTEKNITAKDFIRLSENALNNGGIGSSAGGERPKFTAVMNDSHVMVKFAGPLSKPDQRRWADLLLCEAIAYSVLNDAGVTSVKAKIFMQKDYCFLQTQRFDRVGLKGRKPYLSFAGVDSFLFGDQSSWSHTAENLFKSNRLSKEDFEGVCLIEAFAQLIGDTDRHFYNLGFFPEFENPSSLIPNNFRLAPVFDKSPMVFAPYDGRILNREFEPGVPRANLVSSWSKATELAKVFWRKVSKEKSISPSFRKISLACLKKL